jgi:pimeloyl-ACP methyl ester carboxylesterase
MIAPTDAQVKSDKEPQPKGKSVKEPAPDAKPATNFKHLDSQVLVFVANGVSGSTVVSDHLMELNSDLHLGLRIQMVPWTRHNSHFHDLTDCEAQLAAADRIARSIGVIRKDAPNAQIVLIGHSAGARVALAAAEMSAPKSVDRIILLHPAISSHHDLSLALKASKNGIDNFYSTMDCILDNAEKHPWTAATINGPAAGRVGFQPASSDKKEIEAFHCNVRQYAWSLDYCGSGGHFAWTLRHNMKKVVVPLLFQ